jgi:hypothetical protein
MHPIRRLMAPMRTHLGNERGQDVLVVLLVIFLIWLLVTGRQIIIE